MSVLPFLTICSIIATVFAYWIHKHPRMTASDSAQDTDEDVVISLDDDSPFLAEGSAVEISSPVPFYICLVITNVLILTYVMFGRGGGEIHDEEMTFDEFAVNRMGKQIAALVTAERVQALVIIPRETADSQYNISMVKSLKNGHGFKVKIIAEEKTTQSHLYVTAEELNAFAQRYPEIEMIISLVYLRGSVEEISQSSFPRHLFVAVFDQQARLNENIELIHSGFINFAMVSKGIYEKSAYIPKEMALDQILDTYFIMVTNKNANEIKYNHRQLIVKFPFEKDPFLSR